MTNFKTAKLANYYKPIVKSQNTPHLSTVCCCSTNKLTEQLVIHSGSVLGVSTNHWADVTGEDKIFPWWTRSLVRPYHKHSMTSDAYFRNRNPASKFNSTGR